MAKELSTTADQIDLTDYADILTAHGLTVSTNDFFLMTGEIPAERKWVLHLSIILPQITTAIDRIIPLIKQTGIVVSMAKNSEAAMFVLNGKLGYMNFPKVITFYPISDLQITTLAEELKKRTIDLQGPEIPTAAPLGGVVYVEYVQDLPFTQDMWPFPIKMPVPKTEHRKVFNGKYMITHTLKQDVKGYVYKGLYWKGFLRLAWCVIKQGKANMCTDEANRNMGHRLRWQMQLQQELQSIVNVPKIIDLYTAEGHTYLVMEFIKGEQLFNIISNTFRKLKWKDLPATAQQKIVGYLIRIIDILTELHQHGYIHRDVTPPNFIIDTKDRIYLMDLELTYNAKTKQPEPPFKEGSTGFCSEEQLNLQTPTRYEDIYALGGMMLYCFTNIIPENFDYKHPEQLRIELEKHLQVPEIIDLIIACYSQQPEARPTLTEIKNTLQYLFAQ